MSRELQYAKGRRGGSGSSPASGSSGSRSSASLRGLRPMPPQAQALADRGINRCRTGDWKDGLVDLAHVVSRYGKTTLPSPVYSYLGYGIAKHRRELAKGIRMCRHAVRLEFYQPENYVNLAKACLLAERYRRDAYEALRDGLAIDPEHPELLALQQQVGRRLPPVLPFLSRQNLLNRILGALRHQLKGKPKPESDDSSSQVAQPA